MRFHTRDLVCVFSHFGHGVVGHDSQWDVCLQYKVGELLASSKG